MVPLIAIAAEVGAPIVKKILERKIGGQNAELAGSVVDAIARQAGVAPDQLDQYAASNPDVVREAVRSVEEMSPELVSLYAEGLKGQFALLAAEQTEPLFMRAWRPGWMYLLGFFWVWNIVLLHAANAYWKIKLPPVPFQDLLGLTGLFMGLYMGGHTVKDVVGKWKEKT
jgi:hypothetical protein